MTDEHCNLANGVTAMRNRQCGVCQQPLAGQPGYLVQGARWSRRRWWQARFLVCPPCWREGRARWNADHRALPVRYDRLVGRGGSEMPAAQCAACGQMVIRAADPLLKRVTCSVSCSASLSPSRNAREGISRPCDTCGTPITTGRADATYCSPACRQKAYRARRSTN